MMKQIKVKKEKKLISCLLEEFPNLNINAVYKALRKKDIKVNGKRVNQNCDLFLGDIITVYMEDHLIEKDASSLSSNVNHLPISSIDSQAISIVYEDSYILVADKPVGIEVVGDSNSFTLLLKEQIGLSFLEPCHRLDRNTAGLVLFAKTPESLRILLNKFKHHEIKKQYYAKVYGIPSPKKARKEAYLFKDKKKSLVYISDQAKKGYRPIVTFYEVISVNKKEHTSLLDITLETGRTHQIRAHLAHLGYPIIGDGKYGINAINKQFKQKTQLLYSYKITFAFTTPSGILSYLNRPGSKPSRWRQSLLPING